MKKAATFFTSILLSAPIVFAGGGWTSGGGENIRDERNPWWIQNTKEVTYCIKADERNFGQSRDVLQRKIRFALNFWKKQLGTLTYNQFDQLQGISVGTQTFTETACGDNTDLVFQFGVLDGDQFRYLVDPTKFIGVAVRTAYDPVNLKGKGFIYISPEEGPLRFNKSGLMTHPWSYQDGILLTPALIHELGHVFGIPHQKELPLLAEDFLESTLGIRNEEWVGKTWKQLEEAARRNEVFFFRYEPSPLMSFKLCLYAPAPMPIAAAKLKVPVKKINSTSTRNFDEQEQLPPTSQQSFNLLPVFFGYERPNGNYCHGNDIQVKNGKYFYEFSYTFKDKEYHVGKADLERSDDGSYADLISIWLPKSQKVYQNLWRETESQLPVAYYKPTAYFKGEYHSYDGKVTRPISIVAKPFRSLTVGGILNGKYYFDIFSGF
ncbi:MAG: hypothetical protein ACXVCR_01290 [Bdellovibrio sp.]